VGCGQLEIAGMGVGAASACVVGAESTACARVMRAVVGGTVLTGGVHVPAREGARTGGQR
jgi:hypothetical protein